MTCIGEDKMGVCFGGETTRQKAASNQFYSNHLEGHGLG